MLGSTAGVPHSGPSSDLTQRQDLLLPSPLWQNCLAQGSSPTTSHPSLSAHSVSYHGWAHLGGSRPLALQRHVSRCLSGRRGRESMVTSRHVSLPLVPRHIGATPDLPPLFWGCPLAKKVASPQGGCKPAPLPHCTPSLGTVSRRQRRTGTQAIFSRNKWREIALTGEQPLFRANFHIIESNCFPFLSAVSSA